MGTPVPLHGVGGLLHLAVRECNLCGQREECSTRHAGASGRGLCPIPASAQNPSGPWGRVRKGTGKPAPATGFHPSLCPSDCCLMKNGQGFWTQEGHQGQQVIRDGDPLRWSTLFFFFFWERGGNVSQLWRAARHWGQRLETARGREGSLRTSWKPRD